VDRIYTHCLLRSDLYALVSHSRRLITACYTPLPPFYPDLSAGRHRASHRAPSPRSLYENALRTLVYSSVGIQGTGFARVVDERSRIRCAFPPMHLMISFPLRLPLVLSLVDCTLDALERLERIVDAGAGPRAESLWFHSACLQAPEVSLSGSRFMFRYALVTPCLTLPS